LALSRVRFVRFAADEKATSLVLVACIRERQSALFAGSYPGAE
jgi:hypothetical protein